MMLTVRDNPQILFLNKNDLFERKVQHSPIKNFFPVSRAFVLNTPGDRLTFVVQDYDGEPGDSRAGRDYFKRRFARLAQKANAKEREIYIQLVSLILNNPAVLISLSITTATDTAMLRVVMAAVEGESP